MFAKMRHGEIVDYKSYEPLKEAIEAYLINSVKDKKSLVVSQYYWYNEPYIGSDCNEMINCSSKSVFSKTSRQNSVSANILPFFSRFICC